MKIQLLAFVCTAGFLAAADVQLPTFVPQELKAPELSLVNAIRTGQVTPPDAETKAVLAWVRNPESRTNRLVSRMPVIEPSKEVDKNMPILPPDPSKDFKIIVIEPQVELVK